MKILVISNLYPPDVLGGYELSCKQVADGLGGLGHDVTVLTSIPRNGPVPAQPGVLRRLRLADVYDHYTAATSSRETQWRRWFEGCHISAANVHTLCEIVEADRPDVAYLFNTLGNGGLGLIAALQQMGVPWVMHIADRVPLELCVTRPYQLGAHSAEELLRLVVRECRGRFLSCSQILLDEVTKTGPQIQPFTRVLPNWVVGRTTPRPGGYMPGGRLRIVTAGTLSPNKGSDVLIAAAGQLRDRGHSDFVIDVYTLNSDPRYVAEIQRRGLGEHVRLLGSRSQAQLDALYDEYDLFAFPTWAREPFGLAPMEAMARGCVPVVSRVCGFSEWFVDGIDCIKADRTAKAFADVFEDVIRGRVDLAGLGRRGAKTVRDHHRLDTILPQIVDELEATAAVPAPQTQTAGEVYRTMLIAEKAFGALIHEVSAA